MTGLNCRYPLSRARQDVIANVPPHWNEGVKEDHGSRWAGQVTKCLSTLYFCLCTAVSWEKSARRSMYCEGVDNSLLVS
jgi:hypothetical protein